jgi:hypothetical protein
VVLFVIPRAGREMYILFLPALVVGLIYKVAHFEDWGKIDVVMLLTFQFAVWFVAASLYAGHFKSAVIMLGFIGAILALVASFAKSL